MIQIPYEFISPYFAEKLLDKNGNDEEEKEEDREIFEVGSLYSLQGDTCDDFEMPLKIYKLKKVIKSINGIPINAIVVKQVNPNKDKEHIFSLTKTDCQIIGVPFEERLEIYPIKLGWKKYDETKKESVEINKMDMGYFSSKDLSTYPNSREDESIRRMTIKIAYRKMLLAFDSPLPSKIKLSVEYKDDFKEMLIGNFIKLGSTNIKCACITKAISPNPSPYNDFVDLDGNIYIEITFKFISSHREIGIMPSLVKNKSLDDILIIKTNITPKEEKEATEELLKEIEKSFSERVNNELAREYSTMTYKRANARINRRNMFLDNFAGGGERYWKINY